MDFTTVIYGILIGFVVNLVLCPMLIPFLTRLKIGQQVRDDGPSSHLGKSGTPTMGGIGIVISIVIASLIFFSGNMEVMLILGVTLCFGVIGFVDDYIKVVKKRSLGLRFIEKIVAQSVVSVIFIYFITVGNIGDFGGSYSEIIIPFTDINLELGILYYPFAYLVILGTVNAVNLTDGLDGLASGVMALVLVFFMFMAYTSYVVISPVVGIAIGSLLAFLLFNAYPAKVFMGDTGSLALGGFLGCVALMLKLPLFLVIVGIIFIMEALSVMIQVGYFKISGGKRIFKMAPIHHHFELCGMKETKVVAMFYIITAIACLIGFLAV